MAAQLDLIIGAAQEIDVAVGEKARQIAGAINAPIARAERGNGEKALGGELGALPVAARHAVAADEQLADLAGGNGIELRIEHVDLRVGDGPADGDRRAHIFNAAGGGPDRGLGGAVHVVNLALEDLAQMMNERRGNGLAAEQHLLERAERGKGARIERQHARQRRRHLQMRDVVAADFIGDGCRAFVAMDDDGKAAGQGPEQLENRDIKGHAGDGQPDAGLAATPAT